MIEGSSFLCIAALVSNDNLSSLVYAFATIEAI